MVKKWEIYFADLDPSKGSEQSGKRPVLIISNDAVNTYLPVHTVIPFSSYPKNGKIYPTEIFIKKEISGLKKDSILMLQQIRTISTQRLGGAAVSAINDSETRNAVHFALKEYFDI